MQVIMMDVDGVLVRGRPADGRPFATDLEVDLGISAAVLQREFFKPHWVGIVTGQHPMKPTLERVLAEIAPKVPVDTFIDYWFRNDSRLDLEVLDALTDYRRDGVRVLLATNQEHMRADYLMNTLGLAGQVDGIIYSAAVGYRKPSVEFYEGATERAGVHPKGIALVDDTLENVVAAQAFGWNAVHWQDGMQLRAALEAISA
ncbi:MAG TPA: HAD-IA family hydrolase [Devosiaceae bacterium]|jgi:putative hydrolase of the HAD superfamily